MTNHEAIARLEESVSFYDTECPEDKVSKFKWEIMQRQKEVYLLAIAAMEMREPKELKDKISFDGKIIGKCPTCGCGTSDDRNFCNNCGQRLRKLEVIEAIKIVEAAEESECEDVSEEV